MPLRPRKQLTDMDAINALIESSQLSRGRMDRVEMDALEDFLVRQRQEERDDPRFRLNQLREVAQAEELRKASMAPEDVLRELSMGKSRTMENKAPGDTLYRNPNQPPYAPGQRVDATNVPSVAPPSQGTVGAAAQQLQQSHEATASWAPTPPEERTHGYAGGTRKGAAPTTPVTPQQRMQANMAPPKDPNYNLGAQTGIPLQPAPASEQERTDNERYARKKSFKNLQKARSEANRKQAVTGVVDWSRLGAFGVKNLFEATAVGRTQAVNRLFSGEARLR
jgi:hypothetical protein